MSDVVEQIKTDIAQNDVVVFMKGTKKIPQCGFSSVVATIMERVGVEFLDRNVLADPDLREQIKVFSDWPTIPQLYIKGEFIGGCDITREMYESGELEALLKEKGVQTAA
jgi:monothiol glutaredoxin